MKPRLVTRGAPWTSFDREVYVSYDSSTTPWTRKETIVDRNQNEFRTSSIETLDCDVIRRGDKHTPNPFWFRKVEQKHMSGSYTQTSYTNGVDASQGFRVIAYSGPEHTALHNPLQIPFDEAFNKALGRLNEKLRGAIDLSVDLAQTRQVAGMFKQAARLETYTRGFTRRTLANKWLEFTYGWRPLAQSLYGAAEQVYDRAFASTRCTARATSRDSGGSTVHEGLWYKSQKNEVSCRVLLSFDYEAASPRTDQAARLTSLNPISIAWELVPYSFVVDWVYDIGSFLRDTESYLVASTGNLSRGYQTATSISIAKATWVGHGKVHGGFDTTGILNGSTTLKAFNRQLLSFWPLPRPPVLKADLGASRLISAASLLAQHLGVKPQERVPKRSLTTEKWDNFKQASDAAERSSYPKFKKR